MEDKLLEQYRFFLKDYVRLQMDFSQTEQNRGISPPPLEKPFDRKASRIDLIRDEWPIAKRMDIVSAIENRRSRRTYQGNISVAELAFLLWATQGIRQHLNPATALRTVPSAGARHALETYLCVLQCEELEVGVYRYLPVEHQLVLEFTEPQLPVKLVEASLGQNFVGQAAVVFVWTTIPQRMEWRYGIAAHKVIALDAGHVCQNLYLACEAIDAGTCAIAAYHQDFMDQLLRVDGQEEFTIYLAPVGKSPRKG